MSLFMGLLCAIPSLEAQEKTPFVRYPALSPDGSQLAFSFQGDIWVMPREGGRAYRLTIHEAYEYEPQWSPDGKNIAFISNRYGNDDIFITDAEGTKRPQRITHHSATDNSARWLNNSELLFSTKRVYAQAEWENEIYKAKTNGETPVRMLNALGYMPTPSPDGKFIAFTKGYNTISRKNYLGPADKEIWIYDTQKNSYHKLLELKGNDMYPDWGPDNQIYFLSENGGVHNIYKIKLDADGKATGSMDAVTNFKEDGVRYFDVSADGKHIVLERETKIFTMSTEGGKPQAVSIKLPQDYRHDPTERITYRNRASNYTLSPNGKLVALNVRGNIFLTSTDKEQKRTNALVTHPYHDKDPVFLNDTTLLFVSDREGQYDIYMIRSSDADRIDLYETLKYKTERLTKTDEDEQNLIISPDGKKIAYIKGRGSLIVADIDANGKMTNLKTLTEGWNAPSGIAWSPDSRWLAYSQADLYFNYEIFIQAADGSGKPTNVSLHPRRDSSPVWSKDGSKLGFVSVRNNSDADIWFVWLKKEDWEKTKYDWEDPYKEPKKDEPKDEDEKDNKKDKKKKKDKEVEPIEIDFERIHERLVQVTNLPGDEYNPQISHDGETFFFTGGGADREIHSIKWDGSEIKAIGGAKQNPYGLSLDPKGARIYFMKSGGTLASIPTSGGAPESINFAARMEIDYETEQEQIFEETWRALDQQFYDPKFHGQDWKKLRNKYKPWAMQTTTKRDFQDVMNLMLGELNASHMGFYTGERSDVQYERVGLLGLEVKPHKEGVEIMRIVQDSPADRKSSKLEVGEIILSIDGERIRPETNFYSYLTDKVNDRVLLEVKAKDGKVREFMIRPTSSLRNELYEEWVRERRTLTEKYSNGKLGYLHIQGMNMPSFERFERELAAVAEGKEGIVIDVRYNGGGWTTDYLMTILNYQQHSYTVPRGAAKDLDKENKNYTDYYPFGERLPYSVWTKHSVALCNEFSYSNAEIFSHAYKAAGLGTLVGQPTFGAVISTGAQSLIDGSRVRIPFRAWYVKDTGLNMENGPAVPDVLVSEMPDTKHKGEDPQLKKAVEILLQQMAEKR
ncbi:MAG: PD40 domain-containing protein [Bernardetiaceae bacterium]|nr:PD40 domain-containing protein [Bernardetiaceae bacterium]